MFTLLITVLAQAATATAPPAAAEEVVVIGRRFHDELARCLEQACPPEREIDAALNASVEDFRQGRYGEARALLQRTIGRNKKYAAQIPGPMSDLYATYADLSLHDGYVRDQRSASFASVDVLRKHLGRGHPAALAARPSLGDMMVTEGRPIAAEEIYRDAARDARAAGQQRLADWIDVRRAWLAVQLRADRRALTMLDQLAPAVAADPELATVDRAIRVRIAIRKKDDALVDRLIGEWRVSAGKPPVLLYEPVIPFPPASPGAVMSGSNIGNGDIGWVDIGFWVRPSGAVDQAEALRPDAADSWAGPLVKQIAGRRYAPLDLASGSPGVYRIERVTLRSSFDIVTGSRIAARNGPPQVIRADLTETLAQTTPATP